MVEIADIKDEDSLKAWLEDQPREVTIWIASRAAARQLLRWWHTTLTKDRFRTNEMTLSVLRRVLLPPVAPNLPLDNPGNAVHRASSSLGITPSNPMFETVAAVLRAGRQRTGDDDDHFHSYGQWSDDDWEAIKSDADMVVNGASFDASPLQPKGTKWLNHLWGEVKVGMAALPDAKDWQFWIARYDALLDGRPMLGDAGRTWEMLEEIVLIDPTTWDKGPEVVNPVIREIWELHRLRAEVAALQAEKAAFLAVRASAAQRGHNQPPGGLVDDAPEMARQITIIWDGLDEAREELEQDAPDKGVLRVIAERMLAALNAVVAYCGKVTDAAVMSAAKVGGGAVGAAVLDHVANNGRLMRFVKDLLAFGGGG